MKKLLTIAIAVLMMLSLMVGCTTTDTNSESSTDTTDETDVSTGTDTDNTDSEEVKKFGVIADANNEWNDRLYQGAVDKAEELGGWEIVAFDPQGDVETQINMVTSCATQGYTAISVQPIDNSALAPAMKEAAEAGVIVISHYNLDSELGLDDIVYQVIYDQTGISYNLALQFIEANDFTEGQVAVIGGRTGADNTNQRHEGFEQAFAEYPGIEEVAKIDCEWDKQLAMDAAADILTSYPDIDAFICMTDVMALGTIQAIEDAGLTAGPDGIYVVGEEFYSESAPYIEDGQIALSITCPASWFSKTAVEVADNVVNGVDQEMVTMLDYYWVTTENVDTAEY